MGAVEVAHIGAVLGVSEEDVDEGCVEGALFLRFGLAGVGG